MVPALHGKTSGRGPGSDASAQVKPVCRRTAAFRPGAVFSLSVHHQGRTPGEWKYLETDVRRRLPASYQSQIPTMAMTAPDKPTLLWDGECGFCARWIRRWQKA